ncbi:MAG: hypothetical protein AAGG51_14160 [Cyanobacteria bacterium P01_G01_bin.54]
MKPSIRIGCVGLLYPSGTPKANEKQATLSSAPTYNLELTLYSSNPFKMAKPSSQTLIHRSIFCLLGFGSFGWISTSALTGELKLVGLSLLILGSGILLKRSIQRSTQSRLPSAASRASGQQ